MPKTLSRRAGEGDLIMKRNYAQQKVAPKRSEKELTEVALSERFPKVSGISVRITYHGTSGNPVLMVRTVNYFENTEAVFLMQCFRKDCLEGGFNLEPKIAQLVKNRLKSGVGKMACAGSASGCNATISFEIKLKYQR